MDKNELDLQTLLEIRPQQNISDIIYEKISGLIREGKLKEGYIFPNETVLCEQLGIGRSTIREAYKALELSGYVTRSKKGTFVNSRSAILGATPLKKVVNSVSAADFLEFRLMLEGKNAELAALHASEQELNEMKEILDRLSEARDQNQQNLMIQYDREFHEKITSSTHNELMITAMTAVSEIWESARENNFFKASEQNPSILDQMISTHKAILAAICNHDSAKARVLMEEHIRIVSAV